MVRAVAQLVLLVSIVHQPHQYPSRATLARFQLEAQLVARHTTIQLMEHKLHLQVVVLLQPTILRGVPLSPLVDTMLLVAIGIHAQAHSTMPTLVP